MILRQPCALWLFYCLKFVSYFQWGRRYTVESPFSMFVIVYWIETGVNFPGLKFIKLRQSDHMNLHTVESRLLKTLLFWNSWWFKLNLTSWVKQCNFTPKFSNLSIIGTNLFFASWCEKLGFHWTVINIKAWTLNQLWPLHHMRGKCVNQHPRRVYAITLRKIQLLFYFCSWRYLLL